MSAPRWSRFLIVVAGLLGIAGVATGAAGAHAGGGGLASTASTFFLVHAAAVCGITALAQGWSAGGTLGRLAASVLCFGTVLFAGDVALVGLAGLHIVSGLAPTGGILLMVGWAILVAAPVREAFAKHGSRE